MSSRARSVDLTVVHEWKDGAVRAFEDALVGEEPLEIRVNGAPLTVTMRTPGNDLELAAGFLFTEGLVRNRSEIKKIEQPQNASARPSNVVEVELQNVLDRDCMQRNFFAASSCGICGKASIEQIRVRGIRRPDSELRVSGELLCSLPDRLRSAQRIFEHTGSLHAAAIFDLGGNAILAREDVGRHNAVDKVIGWALMNDRVPLRECLMLVSGRGGFEIVQKALVAGIPLLACVSAPSSLAVRLAREFGQTLVGFLRGNRFVVYSGAERLIEVGEQALQSPHS